MFHLRPQINLKLWRSTIRIGRGDAEIDNGILYYNGTFIKGSRTMVIVWSTNAKNEFKKIYEYILKDSYQNAIKVRNEIIAAVLSLPEQPEKHRLDKY